jgi:hypothetical protein
MNKYKEIVSEWNYVAKCTFTSHLALDLENFKSVM